MNIPFSPPDITDVEIEEVIAALKSGWITTGPKTKEFERQITEYCGSAKTVCLSAATTALEMTLRVLGIGKGDEVIVPAYTYTASCSVICHVGATPVMIDSQTDREEMDYSKMAEAITEKTKAIIPVDIAGTTSFHLGNIMCALSGILLGPWLGGLAAGLGVGAGAGVLA